MSGEDRRKQLLSVAIDLFSRKGFNGTTTKEIAESAGVTEPVIFRHFETKQQLYSAIIDQRDSLDRTRWIAETQEFLARDDDAGFFRHLIKTIIDVHRTDPKFERLMLFAALEGNEIALLYRQRIIAGVLEKLCSYIARRQRAGAIRKAPPASILFAVVSTAQQFALCRYIHGVIEPDMTDEEAIKLFTQIAIDGILMDKK